MCGGREGRKGAQKEEAEACERTKGELQTCFTSASLESSRQRVKGQAEGGTTKDGTTVCAADMRVTGSGTGTGTGTAQVQAQRIRAHHDNELHDCSSQYERRDRIPHYQRIRTSELQFIHSRP